MRKTLPVLVLVLVLVGAAALVRALTPSEVSVTLRPIAARMITAGDLDVPLLDVTIAPGREDVLDTLFVKQNGSAQWQRDLIAAEFWVDEGAAGFQGIGMDRKIAAGAWNGNDNGWTFDRMGEDLSAAGKRFFVTVDVYYFPTSFVTVALTIPSFRDDFRAMQYDTGDRGIFLRTARPAPAAELADASHTIQKFASDALPPVVRITEPADGASLARDWVVVRGVAQDVGGSSVAKVLLSVNRVGKAATWVDAVPETAGFGTWEVRLFELPRGNTLELRVQAEDGVGNKSAISAPRRITFTE